MDIVSIIVLALLGLASWGAYRLISVWVGKKDHARSHHGGTNDRPPERKIDVLGR